MTSRKKRLKLIQIFLLTLGVVIIFFTYVKKDKNTNELIFSKKDGDSLKSNENDVSPSEDIFYNIEYSGLDISGNRYILKSKEAKNNQNIQGSVDMKFVDAIFYFKDGTSLFVKSDKGIYNNKTLDMNFSKNVEATYEGSKLFADEADYSNSNSMISLTKNVKVRDIRGTMVADKILFDIKKKTLNINSFDDKKVNANIILEWKKILEF